MLKQYYLTITDKTGDTTEHWFIGDTEDDRFFEVHKHLTFNEAAAFLAEKKKYEEENFTLIMTCAERFLCHWEATPVEFAKGNAPDGCIS